MQTNFTVKDLEVGAAITAEILELIQCWGSAYSSVGGPFDDGSMFAESEETKFELVARITELTSALVGAQKMIAEAHPKFNWGASFLDANAITLLNEVPLAIGAALTPKGSIYA